MPFEGLLALNPYRVNVKPPVERAVTDFNYNSNRRPVFFGRHSTFQVLLHTFYGLKIVLIFFFAMV